MGCAAVVLAPSGLVGLCAALCTPVQAGTGAPMPPKRAREWLGQRALATGPENGPSSGSSQDP